MLVKNLQGDVIALVDDQGDTVLEYSYDPWGKLEYKFTNPNMDETTAMVLTSLCPLTYRGYNYDFSTGLYYLQSRYYSPEWGRFLNTDDTNIMLAATGENNASNLFAYCENNPVNKVDYSGEGSSSMTVDVLLIYFLIPVLSVYKKLIDIGKGYIFETAIDIRSTIAVDKKSGISIFNFFVYTYKDDDIREAYYFTYFYGSHEQWTNYIKILKSNIFTNMFSSLGVSLGIGIITTAINPLVGLMVSLTTAALSFSASSKKQFATASEGVLANTGNKNYYGCMDIIVRNVSGIWLNQTVTVYKGDQYIYVIQ